MDRGMQAWKLLPWGLRKAFPSASVGGSVGVSLTRDSLGGATGEVCLGKVGPVCHFSGMFPGRAERLGKC